MTSSKGREARFAKLKTVPPIAAHDHRLFLDEQGRDQRIMALPRHVRRKLKAEGRKLAFAYNRVLKDLEVSGAGYEADQFLRQMAREYTHRYADSGLHTQPVSFNYFEAFCLIDFLDKSVAPYAAPRPEIDHLFSIADYFDYITSRETGPFALVKLMDLPEGKVFHYTPNGALFDFTYTNADGRDFVVSGFSLVRHGTSLHWSLIGGEVYTEADWAALAEQFRTIENEEVNPQKTQFLAAMRARNGDTPGEPLALGGSERARKTILAGEIDLMTSKHLGRYLSTEAENAFQVICDDPELKVGFNLSHAEEAERRKDVTRQIEHASVLWDLAEAMLQLPAYFNHKVEVVRSVAVREGRRAPATAPKAVAGAGVRYRYVSALDFVDITPTMVRTITAPHYAVETAGYWKRLEFGGQGVNAAGETVSGRTWVQAEHNWRARPDVARQIYIKSSVAQAKLQREVFLEGARKADASGPESPTAPSASEEARGVLYILRCLAMEAEVYKVGWTTGTAPERASQLSRDTGVPSAFIVIDRWAHPDPASLEAAVHAMLAPYRISHGREFFKAPLVTIKDAVETEIRRMARRG